MSHYIYRLFINFLLIHYFIYRLVRWSAPNVVNLASIVHTLIGTARVSDYLHFFCKVYKYWNLHSGILCANSARTVRLFRNRRYIHSDLVVRVFCSKRYVFPLLL